jgi:dTDP-4-dehydrorhamnose reductase
MANVLVTGASGLLGSSLVPVLKERGHRVTRLGRSRASDVNANLISYEQASHALDQVRPEIIINLTALTDVDRCETNPQEAYLLNVKPVQNLAVWMQSTTWPCHLIQISSDQVYDGAGVHSEGEVTIRNHYAMSKLAGEFAALTVPSTILRTNFVGRSMREGRASLTDWLYDALRDSKTINVFDDVIFSPLATTTLCDCIERCIAKRPLGIFNVGSREGMSKADFAFAFAEATGLSRINLVRSSSSSIGSLAARRPADMRMQCDKFEGYMELRLPRLLDEIQLLARDYS